MEEHGKISAFASRFCTGFYICLVLLLAVDLVSWFMAERKVHFPWEGAPFFYAAYGYVACVALIFIAKGLRRLVQRKEEYYD
ncbi:MAG: hypothetical protein MI892_29970 [Desulfobacterales bacterium]|nr:hypothetical protein [Desulfobacterales bacterium]